MDNKWNDFYLEWPDEDKDIHFELKKSDGKKAETFDINQI